MGDRKFVVPEYGPLAGMRVIGAGSLIAMPFAISMLADFGAEVIQLERPSMGGDNFRRFGSIKELGGKKIGTSFAQDGRNRLSVTLELNLRNEDAKDIFYGLIKESDVFVENLVWLDKLGIRDEDLLEINPALIIVHISGFGHKEFGGIPEICDQASYDIIGQAYSGFSMFNGKDGEPPVLCKPGLNDYVTALFALFGILSAYHYAEKTGKGQVIDVTQFESMAKILREGYTKESMGLGRILRYGNKSDSTIPWDSFLTKDDRYIVIGAVGEAVYTRFAKAIGADLTKFEYKKTAAGNAAINSEYGLEFEQIIKDWCRERNAEEIADIMRAARVPCSVAYYPDECLDLPHYNDRNDFVTYTDQTLGMDIKAFGIAPKFSETPGQIWRGAPALGQDTEPVLKTILGYSDEKIEDLRNKKVI